MMEPISIMMETSENTKRHSADATFKLDQNFPNPFNPITTIQYELFLDCYVKFDVFNSVGQKVVTLVDEYQKTGLKIVKWNGKNRKGIQVPSGIYFCRLLAGNSIEIRKMVLVR